MSEVRLIDANKLLKKCIEGDGNNEFTKGYNFAVNEISAYIELAPTVEPEVRHGRWVHHNGGYSDHFECTACGNDIVLTGKWKFCPNCGARMDLRTPTEVQLDEADSVMMGGAYNG